MQDLVNLQIEDCTGKNFPQKTFFDSSKKTIFSFYRQGYAIFIDETQPDQCYIQKIISQAIGETQLYKNEVLIVRSSHKIFFLKMSANEDTGLDEWHIYHTLSQQGRLSGNKTSN